jgi:hypothetical protein
MLSACSGPTDFAWTTSSDKIEAELIARTWRFDHRINGNEPIFTSKTMVRVQYNADRTFEVREYAGIFAAPKVVAKGTWKIVASDYGKTSHVYITGQWALVETITEPVAGIVVADGRKRNTSTTPQAAQWKETIVTFNSERLSLAYYDAATQNVARSEYFPN